MEIIYIKRDLTAKEKFIHRCYFKHFHPDKFIGHPKFNLVNDCAKNVNAFVDDRIPGLATVITQIGLTLKKQLNG